MPRKTKTTKRKRKSPEFEGIRSMERTMEATTKMVGTVAVKGDGYGCWQARLLGGWGNDKLSGKTFKILSHYSRTCRESGKTTI